MAQLKDLLVNGASRLLNGLNVNGPITQNGTAVSLDGHSHSTIGVYTASSTNSQQKIYLSTSTPSGASSGDIWIKPV